MLPPTERVDWVRYEVGPALVALIALSPAAELAHRRFCEYYWQTGLWPSVASGNAAALGRVTPKQWPRVLVELGQHGWLEDGGRLRHPDAEAVRARSLAALNQARQAGRASAQRRWGATKGDDHYSAVNGSVTTGVTTAEVTAALTDPIPINDKNDKSTSTSTNALKPAERLTGTNDENAEASTLSVSAPENGFEKEKQFLADVLEVVELWKPTAARGELENWGGWWRNRYRQNPRKAQAVLADVRCLVRERRITRSPGQAAVDLWKRLP